MICNNTAYGIRTRQPAHCMLLISLATPAGLEPATCRLEGGCSIQLRYGAGHALRRSGDFVCVVFAYNTLAYGSNFRLNLTGRAGSMGPLVETRRFEIIGIA